MARGAEVLTSKQVIDGKILKVFIDEIQEPHAPGPSRREIIRARPASAVVPVTPDGRIVLVRQYRYAVDKSLWEIPAGVRDPGEDAAECALREMAEETGYRADSVRLLTHLRTTPGFCDETIDLFCAGNVVEGEPDPDPNESFEVKLFSMEQLDAMISCGEITDAKTITGLLLVKAGLGMEE